MCLEMAECQIVATLQNFDHKTSVTQIRHERIKQLICVQLLINEPEPCYSFYMLTVVALTESQQTDFFFYGKDIIDKLISDLSKSTTQSK